MRQPSWLSTGWLSFLLLALVAPGALAHQIDSGYASVEAESDSVYGTFTFDVLDLNRVFRLDRNGDEQVDADEIRDGAGPVQRFLSERMHVSLGDADIALAPRGVDFANDPGGHLLVRYSMNGPAPATSAGEADLALRTDLFREFGSSFKVLTRLAAGNESRDVVLTDVDPAASLAGPGAAAGGHGSGPKLPPLSFIKLGVEHIFIGIDHILFLVALIVVGGRFTNLVKIVTSFTIAHSLTLAAAALGLVSPPSRLVESAIALSIVYVAVENFFVTKTDWRWLVTGFFGLVHGFGFASVLRELAPSSRELVPSLLAFNLGVELGQIVIVTLLWPVVLLISRSPRPRPIALGISGLVALIGLGWFIERAFQVSLGLP